MILFRTARVRASSEGLSAIRPARPAEMGGNRKLGSWSQLAHIGWQTDHESLWVIGRAIVEPVDASGSYSAAAGVSHRLGSDKVRA